MRVMFLEPRNNLELYLPKLEQLIETLIKSYGADSFYFSEATRFAWEVQRVLEKLKEKYPFCDLCYVVTENSDIPKKKDERTFPRYVYLPALSAFGVRDMILLRGVWMIDNCDIVVLYPEQDQMAEPSFRKYVYEKGKTVVMA